MPQEDLLAACVNLEGNHAQETWAASLLMPTGKFGASQDHLLIQYELTELSKAITLTVMACVMETRRGKRPTKVGSGRGPTWGLCGPLPVELSTAVACARKHKTVLIQKPTPALEPRDLPGAQPRGDG